MSYVSDASQLRYDSIEVVKVRCDVCGDEWEMKYRAARHHQARRKRNGNDLDHACHKCTRKLNLNKNQKKISVLTPTVTAKKCGRCKKTKPSDAFYRDVRRADGLCGLCKTCSKQAEAKYMATTGFAQKRYNREQTLKYKKMREQYRKSSAGKKCQERYRSQKENKARKAVWFASQRVLPGAIDDLIPEEWLAILDYYRERCAYCKSTEIVGLEHINTLSLGGDNSAYNAVTSCRSCNSSKRSLSYVPWRKRMIERGHDPDRFERMYLDRAAILGGKFCNKATIAE